jgi:hypothetical protein
MSEGDLFGLPGAAGCDEEVTGAEVDKWTGREAVVALSTFQWSSVIPTAVHGHDSIRAANCDSNSSTSTDLESCCTPQLRRGLRVHRDCGQDLSPSLRSGRWSPARRPPLEQPYCDILNVGDATHSAALIPHVAPPFQSSRLHVGIG